MFYRAILDSAVVKQRITTVQNYVARTVDTA